MPSFKIINNTTEITLNNKWVPATKFNSKDRLVDEKGHTVGSDYRGRQYRLIEKRERTLSGLERFGRGLLGTVAVICTLCLGLFSKSVRNLFTKSKENIRFAILEGNLSSQSGPSEEHPIIAPIGPSEEHPIIAPIGPSEEHPIIAPIVSPKQTSEKSSSKKETTPTVSTKPKNEEYNISEQEQQEISISPDTISKIQICMENVLKRKEEDGIKLYKSQKNHRVFALKTAPGLIFKMKVDPYFIVEREAGKNPKTSGRDESMKKRYQTMIKAQTVVREHKLGLLIIPSAKLFTVNAEGEEYQIIAERELNINPYESAQEQYFQDYSESLNEAIRQLAIFICKTGYSDVEWRNNPILNNSLDENGNRKIALIDIEEMGGSHIGLYGGCLGRRGLVRCVTEAQGLMVQTVAEENTILETESFAKAHAKRKKEIEEGQKLKEYYTTKNITIGNEVIQIDERSFDFSKYPSQVERLKEETKTLVKEINHQILATSPLESIKERRYIYIDTNRGPFDGLNKLIDESLSITSITITTETAEEYYNATYLGYIVKKLIELGHIYKLVRINGHGYYLQA